MKKSSPLAVAVLAAFLGISAAVAGMVGQKLPGASLNFMDKTPDWKGKPVLLEFWATWCPPCRKSIPHLNEVFAKYKDRGLMVIGVTDEDDATVRKFRKSVPMDYHVAIDNGGQLSEKMGISGIPHAFLVNKAGEIVWEGHPVDLTDADIEKILE